MTMTTDEITIVIADDHAMVREPVARYLQEAGIRVVASVSNADDAIEECLKHRPHIVLFDIDMPGLLCFNAARILGDQLPETRIIFLTAFANDRYIEQALEVKEDHALHHYNLGLALRMARRHDEAKVHLERAAELDPRFSKP